LSGPRRVLVVGGGPAGMATAIGFVRRGIDTTLVEISEDWASAGIGLTLLGPTLRALDTIGVADACAAAGFPQDHADFCNAQGERMAIIPFPKLAAERLPAAVCTTRPAFHRVLSNATIDAGVDVRLGLTVKSLAQRNGAVDVELTDGARYSYDLVVAADGLHSRVRRLTFDDAPAPRFTGQAVWRTLVQRPPKLDVYHMFYGRKSKVGLVPVSNEGLYVFAVQNVADSSRPPRERLAELMRDLLDADSELIEHARSCIVDPAEVDYRPTEAMLVPAPWHRGRVVLVGDAAHTTTPHLAFGAGIAVEDAIVLCELADSDLTLEDALARYTGYRYDRCRLVVENAVQLGAWEQNPSDPAADPVRLTRESWAALAQPILPAPPDERSHDG
jgi:2-polyprenyl-6-methoxyphenol hydroxylase-like FAD-dependent oxidoreductase